MPSIRGGKSILASNIYEQIKDSILGKYRNDPCVICGNPYHKTDNHRWYH